VRVGVGNVNSARGWSVDSSIGSGVEAGAGRLDAKGAGCSSIGNV
jgi:hypothetical protein